MLSLHKVDDARYHRDGSASSLGSYIMYGNGDPRQQMTYKYLDYVVLTEFIQCSSPPAKDSSTWLLTAFGRGCSRG